MSTIEDITSMIYIKELFLIEKINIKMQRSIIIIIIIIIRWAFDDEINFE